MGSLLGPTSNDAFLVYHKKNWLEHGLLEYRPLYYRRYVDDIFFLFNSAEDLKRFHSYLNSCHLNISFTIDNDILRIATIQRTLLIIVLKLFWITNIE